MAKAEILSIGTELLLGQILNTNAQFISQELADLGIDCHYHSTVGDNPERIKECLRTAVSRSNIVITTGGLGPTKDDLTTECIAALFGVDLIFDPGVLARIQAIFKERNLSMPESNVRQAYRPQGAELLPNPIGTAPGIIWRVSKDEMARAAISSDRERLILTFPGVPSEMKAMWAQTARPLLESAFAGGVIWSCELKHYGIGESALAEMHGSVLDGVNPTVAPYAGLGECRLRVTAKAPTREAAEAIALPVIGQIKRKSGVLCYGKDGDTLESVVGKMLTQRALTLAVAESCTGGLVSKRLTDIAGSSNYIKLNVVTYADDAKQELLAVPPVVLAEKGAVSRECALAMAQGVRRLARASLGLAITGIAGPGGGSPQKPVGLVYLALAGEGSAFAKSLNFSANLSRSEIRMRSASEALNMVRLYLIDPRLIEKL